MTWGQFTAGLRDVRDHGRTRAYETDTALLGLGYIMGSLVDPCGLVLTASGREVLNHIEEESRAAVEQLEQVARVLGRRP